MEYDTFDFVVEQTCDLDHWVVVFKEPGGVEYNDLTDPFDTKEEAIKWVKHIKNIYHIFVEDDF